VQEDYFLHRCFTNTSITYGIFAQESNPADYRAFLFPVRAFKNFPKNHIWYRQFFYPQIEKSIIWYQKESNFKILYYSILEIEILFV